MSIKLSREFGGSLVVVECEQVEDAICMLQCMNSNGHVAHIPKSTTKAPTVPFTTAASTTEQHGAAPKKRRQRKSTRDVNSTRSARMELFLKGLGTWQRSFVHLLCTANYGSVTTDLIKKLSGGIKPLLIRGQTKSLYSLLKAHHFHPRDRYILTRKTAAGSIYMPTDEFVDLYHSSTRQSVAAQPASHKSYSKRGNRWAAFLSKLDKAERVFIDRISHKGASIDSRRIAKMLGVEPRGLGPRLRGINDKLREAQVDDVFEKVRLYSGGQQVLEFRPTKKLLELHGKVA